MTLVIRPARADDFEDYLRLVVELGTDDPYPFFATGQAPAARLLRSMHARRADNGRDYVQLLVEKDPALAGAILDWGGWVALRVNQYAGSVPPPLA